MQISAAGLLLLVSGLLLVRWSFRRTGEHPHCTVCGYDVSGSDQSAYRCPECGSTDRAKVLVGHYRSLRPTFLGLGGALCLAGMLVFLLPLNVQWVAFAPDSLLPVLARTDSGPVLREASRRASRGELGARVHSSLIDFSLALLADEPSVEARSLLAVSIGKLTVEQQVRLVDLIKRSLTFKTRSGVAVGRDFAAELEVAGPPPVPFRLRILEAGVGRDARSDERSRLREAHQGAVFRVSPPVIWTEGRSEIVIRVLVDFGKGATPVVFRRDAEALEDARLLRVPRSPESDTEVADAVRVSGRWRQPDWAGPNGYVVSLDVRIGRRSVPVAFRCDARVGEAWFRFDEGIAVEAGASEVRELTSSVVVLEDAPNGTLQVLLSPSESVAEKSSLLQVYWDGYLSFGRTSSGGYGALGLLGVLDEAGAGRWRSEHRQPP